MEKLEIMIKGRLPTLNEHDAANRGNRFIGAKMKKDATELVRLQCLKYDLFDKPCEVRFLWGFSGKHDFDNIAFAKKYILDGLVKAGVLVNDNQAWVRGFRGDSFIKVDPGTDRVVVTLYAV